MKKILLVICIILSIISVMPEVRTVASASQDISQPSDNGFEEELYAAAAVLIDASNNRILYEHNAKKAYPMASTTKIMTLVIALEYGNPDDIVTFSPYAAAQPDVQLNAAAGEQYRLKDLLYIMMLRSYNDVAVAVAEHIGEAHGGGGTKDADAIAVRKKEESRLYVSNFAHLMNEKAGELGCTDTYFITPNGLDAEDDNGVHSASAYDMAVIASYALHNTDVTDICTARKYNCNELNGRRNVSITTANAFLSMMDGAIGMKTGFTGKAGYCFVGAVRQDGRTFVTVVLGCGWPPHKTYKWSDTRKLMSYGINNFFPQKILVPDPDFGKICVMGGVSDECGTEITDSLEMLVSSAENIDISYEMPKYVDAPVHKGDVAGYVHIKINDQNQISYPIKIKDDIEEVDYLWFLNKIIDDYTL